MTNIEKPSDLISEVANQLHHFWDRDKSAILVRTDQRTDLFTPGST